MVNLVVEEYEPLFVVGTCEHVAFDVQHLDWIKVKSLGIWQRKMMSRRNKITEEASLAPIHLQQHDLMTGGVTTRQFAMNSGQKLGVAV